MTDPVEVPDGHLAGLPVSKATYDNHGCRCVDCTAARRSYDRGRNRSRRDESAARQRLLRQSRSVGVGVSITYQDFLEAKAPIPAEDGRTDITAGDINPLLFPHQRAIVEWAVRGGRRAIFAAFGLGKSVMQLETLRLVTPLGRRALIICPLGVRAEFAHDGAMLDIPTRFLAHDLLSLRDADPAAYRALMARLDADQGGNR